MKGIFLPLIILFLGLSSFLSSQVDIDIKTFTADDGIGTYSNCYLDKQGYTWFTDVSKNRNVLYRFDGRQFTEFKCGHFVPQLIFAAGGKSGGYLAIMKDKEGFVWIGSTQGVYKMLNGKPRLMFSRENGLSSDSIICLDFDGENNLWMLTAKDLALAKCSNGKHELYELPNKYAFNFSKNIDHCEGIDRECVKLFLRCDSLHTVWWGIYDRKARKSEICRLSNFFSSRLVFTKFFIGESFSNCSTQQGGLLFRNNEKQYYFFDSTGKTVYLDKTYTSYCGSDKQGNHYFLSKKDKNSARLFRDRPASIADFGNGGSTFVFPQLLNDANFAYIFENEIWVTSNSGNRSGYVMRGNSIFDYDSLYPSAPLKKMVLYQTGDNVFWAHKWQRKFSYQFVVSDNSTLNKAPIDINGINIKKYSEKDSTLYCELSFKKRECFSFHKNTWTVLSDSAADHFEIADKSIWYYHDNVKAFVCKRSDSRKEVYKVGVNDGFVVEPSGDACFVLKDSLRLCYLKNGKTVEYSLESRNKSDKIVSFHNGKIYLQAKDARILAWNPIGGALPTEIKGLPPGKVNVLGATGDLICFQKGRQCGWIQDDKVHVIDTSAFPGHSRDDNFMADQSGRIFLIGNSKGGFTKDFLVFEKGTFRSYPLIDSVESRSIKVATCLGTSAELIYFAGTKVYRYSKKLRRFYFIKDFGQNFGYIWDAYVKGTRLYVSGWSPYLATVDLDKCPVTFPTLTFAGITKNGTEIDLADNYAIRYEDKLTARYIAIEKLSQSKVAYQVRIIGLDSAWTNVLGNEIKEFANTPPGEYRFEVRAKGESEVWTQPIGFNLVVDFPWYRTWLAYAIYLILFSGILLLLVKINARRLRLANEQLQARVNDATIEIRAQKHVIEEKHKEITDSINYAERIQKSFLATSDLLNENLEHYFVFFKPKDVVSGDFYWAAKLAGKRERFLLAAADSTGHGVPGAIMSLLNITSLEKAIEYHSEPADILNFTRKTIIERLKKDGSPCGGKDGMDCILMSFDFRNQKMTYAAANNSVWIVRKNGDTIGLMEFDADKMPVGKHDRDTVSFTQHEIDLKKGDLVYAITDGFPDQFGGPKGKKFMYKKLKELMTSISQLPMPEQRSQLEKALNDWKGDTEQVDDITIIGVRI